MSDIEGIKNANETGFALLAEVQGARSSLAETQAQVGLTIGTAQKGRADAVSEAQKTYQAVQKTEGEKLFAVEAEENAKVEAAKQAVAAAEEALRKHQEATKATYGTSLDFSIFLGTPAQSGGRTRL